MSETITSNWVESAKAKVACVGGLNEYELRNLIVALNIQNLLARNSRALDNDTPEEADNISISLTATGYLERIDCYQLLSETELLQAEALFLIREGDLNESDATEDSAEDARPYIFKQGIATMADASNPQDVTLANVLSTDAVAVTLHTIGDSETFVKKAVTAAGKITVTFDGAPDNGTKINYIITRNPS